MLRVYSAAEVHAALPWAELSRTLEAAFLQGAEVPLRHAHRLGGDDSLLLMPAWNARVIVVKLVTVMPRSTDTVQASVLVMDRASGQPLALLDGEALTLRRTAATSALAAQHLARADAQTLLVVGSGRLAGWMARAHVALRPGLRVAVWGRRSDAARALAAQLKTEGLAAAAVDDLPAAVAAAHIVCCATTATQPVVLGAWLRPGTHLDLVGAFRPDMREVDDTAVQRATVVVDTFAGALAEAGDLTQPLARGAIARDHIVAELAGLLRDGLGRPRRDDEITLFKSVGTALEDLAAAQQVVSTD